MLSFLLNQDPQPEPMRVLVVEDDPVQQKVASMMLRKLGAEVDIAENGEQAILASARLVYAFILMDCQMPVMDGLAATSRIRQRESTTSKHVLIIGCSANANRNDCLDAGMDDFIQKPCTSCVLSKFMSNVRPYPLRERKANAS